MIAPGQVLSERYIVEREVGRGGMGVVFAARDQALERPVAIKVLPPDFARDPERAARFRREARLLAVLTHPNIAALFGVEGSEASGLYLIMEFVEGRDLAGIVAEQPLDLDALLRVGVEVSRALEAAHGRGIIHRDLKPQNIILTPAGVVKVLDFGLARRIESEIEPDATIQVLTQAGQITGTPGFMSPEQARGMAQDQRTDIFSLGCLLYHCAAGRSPFQRTTAMDTIVATISETPDWVPVQQVLPAGVRELIGRCLEKDAGRRLSSAAEARALLEQLRAQPASQVSLMMPARAAPSRLPRQLTSFIGRHREAGEVRSLIETRSLVTLTGVGGCGKSRLALQVAGGMLSVFTDGIWFVELAPLSDPARVPATAARALGIREEPGQALTDTLTRNLRDSRALIVLDNCEHLLPGCRELVVSLLQGCPHLKIVATSREGLGIPGETTWQVPSLSVPAGGPLHETPAGIGAEEALASEAVQLFIERARATHAGFELTQANASTVAAICRDLDGMPLAIELAASRVRILSVEQIHEKLGDRFRLLTGGGRGALERQRTLRATMEWSYNLLTDREQDMLCRLSVFAGGWTLPAATAVCGDGLDEFEALDLLTQLADKSLVQIGDSVRDERRFRMLETVRQFAREQLQRTAVAGEIHDRHLAYFLGVAEEGLPHLRGPGQAQWLDWLQLEHENLVSALRWSQSTRNGPHGLRLCAAIWWFWMVRAHFSLGRALLAEALSSPGAEPPTAARAAALNGASALAIMQGDLEGAEGLAGESCAIARAAGDQAILAQSLNNLGSIALSRGDAPESVLRFEESLALRREIGDRVGIAAALNNLGAVASNLGDFDAARRRFEEALQVQRAMGNQHDMAQLLINLGLIAARQGDHGASRRFDEESLAAHRALHNPHGVARVLSELGRISLDQGDAENAEKQFRECLRVYKEQGDRAGTANALNNLGTVALHRSDLAQARELFERSLSAQRELGDRPAVAALLSNLGLIAQVQGDRRGASGPYRESLELRLQLKDEPGLARLMENLGQLIAGTGSLELAAALLACAAARREALRMPLTAAELPRHDAAVAALRERLGEEAWMAWRGRGADLGCEEIAERTRAWLSAEADAYMEPR